MDETTARVARAFASKRPEHLEATTTRPRLTAEEEAWTQLAITVELSLKAGGHDTKGYLSTDGVFGVRPDRPWFWEEGVEDIADPAPETGPCVVCSKVVRSKVANTNGRLFACGYHGGRLHV